MRNVTTAAAMSVCATRINSGKGWLSADLFLSLGITKTKRDMTYKKAKAYIKTYFEFNSELNSWVTEGVVTKQQLDAMNLDEDQIIMLGEDIKDQLQSEVY